MKHIFFNGGGFTGFYEHIGAIQYIHENKLTFDKYYGVSAGVSAIIVLLLQYDIDDFLSYLENIFKQQLFSNEINVTDLHMQCIKYGINRYPDAYKILNNKMFIGITLSSGFIWKSKFTSNEDLSNAVLCSGNIPFVSSYRAKIDTKLAIDGGFGLLEIPPDTLSIKTSLYFPLNMIYPISIFRQIIIQYGYMNVKYVRQKPILSSLSPEMINFIFLLESILPKSKNMDDLRNLLNEK